MKKSLVGMMMVLALAGSAYAGGHKTVNNYYGDEYNTYVDVTNTIASDSLRVSSTALASVELNPDHEGFSVGVGGTTRGGLTAGAVGAMYGFKVANTDVGINVKGYNAEGGYHGGSVGVTVGF